MADPNPHEKGVLLINVSEKNARWNRMALGQSHKERVFIQKATNAGFTERMARFMWEFLTAKDPETPQNYETLTSGDFDPKFP